jgi:hypothetical protein
MILQVFQSPIVNLPKMISPIHLMSAHFRIIRMSVPLTSINQDSPVMDSGKKKM